MKLSLSFAIAAIISIANTYTTPVMACMPPLPELKSSSVDGERAPCLAAPELIVMDVHTAYWEIPLFHDPDRIITGCIENLVIEIPYFSTQTLLISSDGSTYHRDRDGVIHSGFPESNYFRGALHQQTLLLSPEADDQHIEYELSWTTTNSTSTDPDERFALDDDATWHTTLLKSQWYHPPDYCILDEQQRERQQNVKPQGVNEGPSGDESPACATGRNHHTPKPLTPLLLAALALAARRRARH